jgi:aminoglycoside phosphotransferase (APT) family kinase protein
MRRSGASLRYRVRTIRPDIRLNCPRLRWNGLTRPEWFLWTWRSPGAATELALRDGVTREAIAALHGEVDVDAATAAWDESLAAPAWGGPPVWIHGDLAPGNLLAVQGHLSAVIDFACLGVADPACDLQVAWNLFSGESRDAFRAELQVGNDAWMRGRGWALSVALIQLPYYLHTNPALVASSRHVIGQVLADHAKAGRNRLA